MRASVIQSCTPPPLIQFIYSADDLGNIQFKLKNKTIKGIIYQSGYQKRRLQSSFSLTPCGFLQSPLCKSRGFVLTKLFDKISLRTMNISLGKLERLLFWIHHKFWRSIVQKPREQVQAPKTLKNSAGTEFDTIRSVFVWREQLSGSWIKLPSLCITG